MIHAVKILPEYFDLVVEQIKKFEVRKADRPYKIGDFLALNEYNTEGYTGRCCIVKIIYIFTDQYMLTNHHVVIGIEPCAICVDNGPVDPCTMQRAGIAVYGGDGDGK
ncbi:MAG: DUF3850 domain-containing protein [Clostridia bacterium]|nr:DUF3850 domain-containing protein [Clostridia bacterium]